MSTAGVLWRRLWTASIRRQLVIGIAVVHALLMSVFTLDMVQRQHEFLNREAEGQAASLAQALAASSASWVLADVEHELAEVVNGVKSYPGVRFVMVVSPELLVLGHSDPAKVGTFLLDPISQVLRTADASAHVLATDAGVIDCAAPIRASGGRLIGWARVALTMEMADAAALAVRRDGLVYAAVAIGLGVLVAVFIASGLTRDLRRLVEVTDRVRQGARVRSTVQRDDELGRLSDELNRMLDALETEGRAGEALRRQLVESEERLNLALRGANEALWDLDPVAHTVFVFDPGLNVLGTGGESASGTMLGSVQLWRERVHPDDLPRAQAALRAHLEGATPALELEVRLRNARGGELRALVRGTALRDAAGKPYRVLGTLVDVTELRRKEEALHTLEQQLRLAQKMDALGRLAGGVAHDFNNMLAAIVAYTDLAREAVTDPEVRADLHEVLVASARAKALVSQILAFSRGGGGARAPIDVNGVVAEVVQTLTPTLEGITLEALSSPADLRVLGDSAGLHQVVMNLCVNAREALRSGGRITVRVRREPVSGKCSSCQMPFSGDFVELAVEDDGPGVPPELQERIFEPFFTTRQGQGGTGLGLAMVHGTVHAWGGHILITSQPGATRIALVLPPAPSEQAAAVAVVPDQRALGAGRVLLIDDEVLITTSLKRVLGARGFEVEVENDPSRGLARAATEAFAAIITDHSMPGMTGAELARELKRRGCGTPILLCTGNPTVVEDTSGVEAVLAKPVDLEELVRRVIELTKGQRPG